MQFNLTVKAAGDKLKFGKESALVKFFTEGENLEHLVDNFFASLDLPINYSQKKKFLEKESRELTYYSPYGDLSLILIKKVKMDKDFTSDFFRNYFAGLTQTIAKSAAREIHVVIPSFHNYPAYFESENYLVQTIIEGIHLGNYKFSLKSEKKKKESITFILHHTEKEKLKATLGTTNMLMDSVSLARNLVNEPANTLTPKAFATKVKKEVAKFGIKVTILSKDELKKRKMNSILSVGAASVNEPLMMVLNYKPAGASKKIALVGKGVTYDSGGLSLKPTPSMLDMKADMAGGAAVVGIIQSAARLKLNVELIGVVPCVENMVSGSSYKPGDVIVSASGKTIEVKDTDAEGRIILADALYYACLQKPDEIIDFATLTGACVVALGEIAAGLFTSDDRLAKDLIVSSEKTHERIWRLPFWRDYNRMIKSEIADISNLGPRWGGAITAGKFLENFVDEKIPWAHLDIAGPAVKHKENNYTEKYDTGFGVRLIADYLLNN